MASDPALSLRTAANPLGILAGTVLANKYRVERVLGVGGMGMVVAAQHLQLDQLVAIKLMLPEVLGNADAVARFFAEARAAVKIKSEHVARVSDVAALDSGEPYIVMEYLEGLDLSEWLEQRGALSLEQAAEFVIQACDALAEAHALGIVHRDLKPANLFCTRRPDGLEAIKVLDFGISKITRISSLHVTTRWAVMGSPPYMSPEQLESASRVDHRGDIWSLGVILYELTSGRQPFPAESISGVITRVTAHAPEPLSNDRLVLPPAIEAVILRCLDKDRERRFQDVGELAQALIPFAPHRSQAVVERLLRVIHMAELPVAPEPAQAESDPNRTRISSSGAGLRPAESAPPKSSRTRAWRRRTAVLGFLSLPLLAFAWFVTHTSRQRPTVEATRSPDAAVTRLPVRQDPGGPSGAEPGAANSTMPPSLPSARDEKEPAAPRSAQKIPAKNVRLAAPSVNALIQDRQ